MFIKTHFDEPALEAIRVECEAMSTGQPETFSVPFSAEELATLKELAGRLG